MELRTQYVWMPGSGGGGSGGLEMITPSGGSVNSGGRSSTKVHKSSFDRGFSPITPYAPIYK